VLLATVAAGRLLGPLSPGAFAAWILVKAYVAFYFVTAFINAVALSFEMRTDDPHPRWGSLLLPPIWYGMAVTIAIYGPAPATALANGHGPFALLAVALFIPTSVYFLLVAGRQHDLRFRHSVQPDSAAASEI
jgi:hypothetical protein